MSNLNSVFNVERGWSTKGDDSIVIDESFKIHSSVSNPIKEGEIVELEAEREVVRGNSVDLSGAADTDGLVEKLNDTKQLWLCVQGATEHDFSSLIQTGAPTSNPAPSYEQWKIVCIKGNYTFTTEEFVDRSGSGGYTAGDKVAVVNGKLDIINAANNTYLKKFGEVQKFNPSEGANGSLKVTTDVS